MSIRTARTQFTGSRIRPLLAVGVLSLALVTGCSSSDEADNSTTETTAASSAASSPAAGTEDPTQTSPSDDAGTGAPSSTAGSEPAGSEENSSAAAPTGEASGSGEAPSGEASSGEPAPGSDPAPGEAEEGTACGGLTVAAVNGAIGGGTLESAIDVTADAATGDSSCIFGTTTTIDSVLVDKAALTTYLGGELAGLSEAEVLDNLSEVHRSAQTEVEASDSNVDGLTVRTLTGTDLTGGANALSVTVSDGTLVAVSASGPTLAESGLAETTLAVLKLALDS